MRVGKKKFPSDATDAYFGRAAPLICIPSSPWTSTALTARTQQFSGCCESVLLLHINLGQINNVQQR